MLKRFTVLFLSVILFSLCSCSPANDPSKVVSTDESSREMIADDLAAETTSSETLAERNARIVELRKLPWVAITIDDGPNEYHRQVLDGLKQRGVQATFFLLGENIPGYEDMVTQMYDDGHEIGVHSYRHLNLPALSGERLQEQFDKALAEINRVLPDYVVKSMRAPGGQTNDRVLAAAGAMDWRVFGWSKMFDDHSGVSAAEIADTYLTENTVFNGDIILLHLNSQTMVDVTLILVDRLIEEGWTPVTVSRLMERRAGGKAGEEYSGPVL